MKSCALVILFVSTCQGVVPLVQYTPDKTDWSTFYEKAVLNNSQNTDHSPDGVGWIDRDDWKEWDGTIYDPIKYSKKEFAGLICTGSTVRGMYKLFYDNKPFADNVNPTKAEVDNWHAIAVNHVRKMVGYTGVEYTIKPDKCLHLRALWSTEKKNTRKWDTDEYPGTCLGSTNPHCGAGFIPSVADQKEYLPDGIISCESKSGSEGLFSAAKSNIPWSIKWIRPFCSTLDAEGFWGGHTGPWFHRTEFGWDWRDADPSNFNSNAGLRTKWSGPSGTLLYENPDVTEGKFTVKVEGVNPNPRFPGIECNGIDWVGSTNNATECYEKMMENDNCGKRFMTFNSGNFGCACYEPEMNVCEIKKAAQRLTWDFEPVVSSFDGLLIDISKPLSQNSLPYTGRVCPQIIWFGGGGDASHCLQKMIEGNHDQCGRNFITFNAGGGCACYPPDQVTCTKSETSRQSGRKTYKLEVDPSFNHPTTSPPATSTDSPSATPTVSPTSTLTVSPTSNTTVSPTFTPTVLPTSNMTVSPTFAPTVSPTFTPTVLPTSTPTVSPTRPETNSPTTGVGCIQKDDDEWLFSVKNGNVKTKTCEWLAKQNKSKKRKFCEKKVAHTVDYGPPQVTCKIACNSCDPCYENPKSKWFLKKKNGKAVLKTCAYLASKVKHPEYVCKKKNCYQ